MKYRFRIINSAFNVCPLQLQIEEHEFKIVATELSDIEPLNVDTLRFLSGERYDIVIDANRSLRDYWIRIKELSPCWKKIEGFAILRYYSGSQQNGGSVEFNDRKIPSFDDVYPTNKVFNSFKPKVEDIAVTETQGFDSDESILQTQPDQTFHLVFDSPAVSNHIMYAGRNLHNFACKSVFTPLYIYMNLFVPLKLCSVRFIQSSQQISLSRLVLLAQSTTSRLNFQLFHSWPSLKELTNQFSVTFTTWTGTAA